MPLEPKQEPPYYEITTGPGPAGTKYYTALMTQAGTNPPTVTILQNTLSATPTWGYDDVGIYTLTLTGEFTLNKTTVNVYPDAYYKLGGGWNDVNELYIQSNDPDAVPVNGALNGHPITVTVYP